MHLVISVPVVLLTFNVELVTVLYYINKNHTNNVHCTNISHRQYYTCVKTKKDYLQAFPLKVGARQGYNLSPNLLNLFINIISEPGIHFSMKGQWVSLRFEIGLFFILRDMRFGFLIV